MEHTGSLTHDGEARVASCRSWKEQLLQVESRGDAMPPLSRECLAPLTMPKRWQFQWQQVPLTYPSSIKVALVEIPRAGSSVMKLAFSYISGSMW